jgi:hypothetical protein
MGVLFRKASSDMTHMPKETAGEKLFAWAKGEATAITGAERDATRAKIARLKAERLAKEAAQGVTILDKMPAKKAAPRKPKDR